MNGHIQVSVEDSGPGIPPEVIDRMFDPFFTTKTTGIGMGLAICRRVVERHGGRIWARSEPGKGAQFSLRIPSVPSMAPAGG